MVIFTQSAGYSKLIIDQWKSVSKLENQWLEKKPGLRCKKNQSILNHCIQQTFTSGRKLRGFYGNKQEYGFICVAD